SASGAKVCAAGNIGTALSDVVEEAWDVIVVEASSFQLRFIDSFHPSAAALLNVSPDHLDWHGSFEAYAKAKTNLVRNLTRSDVFAFGAGDAVAEQAAASTAAHPVPVSGSVIPPGGVGIEDGMLHLGADTIEAPDLGPDFLSDLAAAAVLARHEGATVAGISSAMASFVPGPHRRRTIGEWDGVQWVDDSKATNPEAAAAAAEAYASVVLIAGGRNKGLDLTPMAAPASIRRVVTIGESAADLNALFGAIAATAGAMAEAVRMAREVARAGDTVLLAPGCASFDMFNSYADRGDRFAAAARTQAGGDGH
ncbi:MAG: UDP-N-acetylmuramoyl-L-alanine--D-glutamate ligase, partial [Thermoanaerobaculia bacterium]|nr:UDP-N-acetylmuramoyl-L-alanine--D-glutamate ligase [Thermoanaerobaculia bacterium]